MKLKHTHDINKYSTRTVLNDVITIPKWRAAANLDFVKTAITLPRIEEFSSNVVHSYKIGTHDQKCHLTKIQDGGGRCFGFHQSAISTAWMGAF